MSTSRRAFLTAAAAAALPSVRAQNADARVDVAIDETVGTIAPEIYGHFVEHLGGVVYDGIWVGEKSKVPNVGGLRKALVDALARVKPGVIRWPGGCFADQYDWRDGIGPRDKRPRRTNFWVGSPEWPKNANQSGPQMYDPNSFGTIEFARFCRAVGAEPYFAANLRSLPAQEFWRWVEYCNSPAGTNTLGDQRGADGEREPLNVKYWGVGNESWGCGGNFRPEDYASEYRRYSAWVPNYGKPTALIGSGPNGGSIDWTRRFFTQMADGRMLGRMWGWALHHYAWNASGGATREWFQGKRGALDFTPEQYYEILREADDVERIIQSHWQVMGEQDPQHRVKIVVDEWGAWYAPGTEPFPEAALGQQNTMRDAVLAGMSLDIFNRHSDKVAMANIAQLVNCLQSLFLAHEDKFCVTPTYHVFDLYTAHQKAKAVRTMVSAPDLRYQRHAGAASMRGLSASGSVNGSTLTVTVTNPSLDQARDVEIAIRGAKPGTVQTTVLAAANAQAHNTFAEPRAVEPKAGTARVDGSRVRVQCPPASVSRLTVVLG